MYYISNIIIGDIDKENILRQWQICLLAKLYIFDKDLIYCLI